MVAALVGVQFLRIRQFQFLFAPSILPKKEVTGLKIVRLPAALILVASSQILFLIFILLYKLASRSYERFLG